MRPFCVKHVNEDYKHLIGVVIDKHDHPHVNPKNPMEIDYSKGTIINYVLWFEETEEGYEAAEKMEAPSRETADQVYPVRLNPEEVLYDDFDDDDDDDDDSVQPTLDSVDSQHAEHA